MYRKRKHKYSIHYESEGIFFLLNSAPHIVECNMGVYKLCNTYI